MTINPEAGGTVPTWTQGNRFVRARQEAGITQQELADRLELDRTTIRDYENDKRSPKRALLMGWAMATGVSLTWLETGIAPAGDGGGDDLRARRDSNSQPSELEFAHVTPGVTAGILAA